MIRPQWTWRFVDGEGRELTEPATPLFTNQYDAEQWLGETWRTLAGQGVVTATVLHEGEAAAPAVELRVG
ncbi:hypothetical protein GCM10023221_28060 [Luteimicrobium xylanilyticum]|uniref:Uncharacterized protein n=1 Tax=Luteimicrobium xylanilyticum TaxID=1133546 RepID=A0A5P9QB56_9MICO|nr:hypothetical protein [Luteimicrobium xylanilyticum]QFU98589.1 hypothetical protein KDY119_02105 [Luteimicrobium xylanilyticum]